MRYLTRKALIDRLREHLLTLTDDEHSICMVAARMGIFCKGFQRFTEKELRQKYSWIADSRQQLSRPELEDVINQYKLGRTAALGCDLCCDAQTIDRDTCMGWDDFTDAQLSGFHGEWYGEPVTIVHPGWAAAGQGGVHAQ